MNKDQFIQACISAMKALLGTTERNILYDEHEIVDEAIDIAIALKDRLNAREDEWYRRGPQESAENKKY